MIDHWLLIRYNLGQWMLRTSMNVMPRCELRDNLRFAIVTAYGHQRELDRDD
jgi:hypothetical protein